MKKSISGNIIFNVIYALWNAAFPLISSVYVARILLKEDVGQIAFAQNIVSYFLTFASLGIPKYGIREIACHLEDKREGEKIFSELFVINLFSTVVCSLLYLGMIFAVPYFRERLTVYLAVALPLFANIGNLDWFYAGQEAYREIARRNGLTKLLCMLVLIFSVRDRFDGLPYALVCSAATVGYFVWNALHLLKDVRISVRKLDCRRHFAPVMLLLGSIIANDIYVKVDTTMLGIRGSAEDVAVYTYAVRPIRALCMIAVTAGMAVLPRLSLCHAQKRREEFSRWVSDTYEIILLFAAPCTIGLLLIPEMMTAALFGGQYLESAALLRILAPLVLIISSCGLLGQSVLIASGKEKYQLHAMAAGAVLSVALNLVLIPAYGTAGAAFASVISELSVLFFYLLQSKREFRLRFEKGYLSSWAAGCVIFGITLTALKKGMGNNGAGFFICCGIGAAVYFSVLIAFKNPVLTNGTKRLKGRLRGK